MNVVQGDREQVVRRRIRRARRDLGALTGGQGRDRVGVLDLVIGRRAAAVDELGARAPGFRVALAHRLAAIRTEAAGPRR